MNETLRTLKSLFGRKRPKADPKRPPVWNGMPCETMVVPAFEAGGIQYFMHLEIAGMAAGRALQALAFNEEHEMKVEKEMHLAYLKSLKECLNMNDIVRASYLTTVIENRLQFIVEPDILYKMASVVFFDETENPYAYDHAYGQLKVAAWKKLEVEHFFYRTPIRTYLPSSDMFDGGLESYIAKVRLLTLQEIQSYISILSVNPQNSALVDYLTLQAGTRKEWLQSNGYLSMNTTSS